MPIIIPPGYAQVTIPFRHVSVPREAVITFGIQLASGTPASPIIANVVQTAFTDAWSTFCDSQVTIGPTRLSAGTDGTDNLAVVGTATFTGAVTSERASANTALLIRKLTARGGRRGRGRVYLPWILAASNVVETGIIPVAGVTAAQTAANNWLSNTNSLAQIEAMVLLHASGNTSPGTPDPITSLSVDPVLGSQRRRLGR